MAREGKQGSSGRPYSDYRLAIELLHSAAPQLPGTRGAAKARGSGLLRAARCDGGPPPKRLLHCLQVHVPQRCRGLSRRPRPSLCGALHDSFLSGLDNNSGKTAPGAFCPRNNAPAWSGAAADSPAPVREKAPGEGGSGGRASRVRGRPTWGWRWACRARERAHDFSPFWRFSPLVGLQVSVVAAASPSGVQGKGASSRGPVAHRAREGRQALPIPTPKRSRSKADRIGAVETTVKSRQLGLLKLRTNTGLLEKKNPQKRSINLKEFIV